MSRKLRLRCPREPLGEAIIAASATDDYYSIADGQGSLRLTALEDEWESGYCASTVQKEKRFHIVESSSQSREKYF